MTEITTTFAELGLPESILETVNRIGFVKPSPIQEQCIPLLLSGEDVLGIAQTGSGKTAAFSLPALTRIDPQLRSTQMLVMAPTRELAIQVANACEDFSKGLGINIATLYGGQRYDIQLKALRRGAQVVVGTPGRILDHLRRKTLNLSDLKFMVLDEADEMLRMGFIDDVETVMAALPEEHQTALFSATMPEPIRRITRRFMKDAKTVRIQASEQNAPDITQYYWYARGVRKNEALLRFLEIENYDAAIIFSRTKSATLDIAELLEKHGYRCAALNGDMTQQLREQTLERLKNGSLDILIATDVAARGLDVERISLVVNYDIPLDAESYVHRIGRTGRAGRAGRALLFVEPRERRLLQNIERLIKKPVDEIELPTHPQLEEARRTKFIEKITKQLEHRELDQYRKLLEEMFTADQDHEILAAAMMMLLQGKQRLILPPEKPRTQRKREDSFRDGGDRPRRRDRNDRRDNDRGGRRDDSPMDMYRVEVGRGDGVEARHIVGAIANEGDIDSRYIGHIKLYDDHSTVELPQGMPPEMLEMFSNTRLLNKQMRMSFVGKAESNNSSRGDRDGRRNGRSNDRRRSGGGNNGGGNNGGRFSSRDDNGRGRKGDSSQFEHKPRRRFSRNS